MKNKDLKRRIIEISYKHKLSHLGSCLTVVDIIDDIYKTKKPYEEFVLSCGHAGLALYVVIEKYQGIDAEMLFEKHGVHPNRDPELGIHVSTGSLGWGLSIACGMALADRRKDVYCLISDGEITEGLVYEIIRIIHYLYLNNLHIFCNVNGYTAYGKSGFSVPLPYTKPVYTDYSDWPFLNGLDAHYHVMNEEEYKLALKLTA